MNAKEYNEILKALSRRSFLRTGSAAMATALLAQAGTARPQERNNIEKAEHDHSVSDPGQENKPLLDLILIPTCRHQRITESWFRCGILLT